MFVPPKKYLKECQKKISKKKLQEFSYFKTVIFSQFSLKKCFGKLKSKLKCKKTRNIFRLLNFLVFPNFFFTLKSIQ